jgi:hypothetical protein
MEELTHLESVSGNSLSIAIKISHALGESLSEIWDQYFRVASEDEEVEQVLSEERDHFWEDL